MTVQWFGGRVMDAIRAATVQGLHRGVEDVANEAVSLILNTVKSGRIYRRNGVSHQASAPGEAPASDLGVLVASLSTSVDASTLTGNVNVSAAHGKFLEYGTAKMSPRPFMRPALSNKREDVARDIAEEVRRSLR